MPGAREVLLTLSKVSTGNSN